MSARRITDVDRMLRWSDGLDKAIDPDAPKRARRRHHRRIDGFDLVVVEETGKPTMVHLADPDSSAGFELTVEQLRRVNQFVEEILQQPPPVRRRR